MTYLQKKKRVFMNVVNSVKGFVRNVSGAFPLVAYDCVNTKGVIDYTITGDGVGDYDEESGKYRIPVVCRGLNLFNPEEAIAKFNSGDTYNDGGYSCVSIQLKPNTKYYIKIFTPVKVSGYFYMSNTQHINASVKGTVDLIDASSAPFPRGYEESVTTDDTGCIYMGSIYVSPANRIKALRQGSIQITEGSFDALSAPDYEPYQKSVATNIYLDKPLGKGQAINYKNDRLPALPAMQGTTIYTVDTFMVPKNMEVTYYSTSKE